MRLTDVISELEKTGHGVAGIKKLSAFLKDTYPKTPGAVTNFLEVEFIKDPIKWGDVKDKVWSEQNEREDNKFHLVQGDIISTTLPKQLGVAESMQDQSIWIVRSVTCDCVRAKYIQVSPLIRVDASNTEFKTALYFTTPNRFPLPKQIDSANPPDLGFYADFTEPFFLERADIESAVVLKSLTYSGWNFFSAVLVNREGRSDVAEEGRLRS